MPINFRFDKLIKLVGIPDVFTEKNAVDWFGIKDPKNSKAYKILSWIYGILRSFLSPSFKTMLFKISVLVFIILDLLGFTYSHIFALISAIILGISAFFWFIFYISKAGGESKTWLNEAFSSIQVDRGIGWANISMSTSIMFGIGLILHNVLNDNPRFSWKMKNSNIVFKDHPSWITLAVVISIIVLYFRPDGLVYLFEVGLWDGYINPMRKKWLKNMQGPNQVSQIVLFIVYISIILVVIMLNFKQFNGSHIKKFSIFNNLIDSTNHPVVVVVFYIWYFLLRTKYDGWALGLFTILTMGDVAWKSVFAAKLKKNFGTKISKMGYGNDKVTNLIGDAPALQETEGRSLSRSRTGRIMHRVDKY